MSPDSDIARDILSAENVWIEITASAHRPATGEWSIGAILWSPSKYLDGQDRYANMRECRPGDIVLHLVSSGSERFLSGASRVKASYFERHEEPPNAGAWSGRGTYYVVPLEAYRRLSTPINLRDFIDANEEAIKADKLSGDWKFYPFVLRSDGIRTDQAYLAKASPALARLFAAAIAPISISSGGTHMSGLWMRQREDDPPELTDILAKKADGGEPRAQLDEWSKRHRDVLGDTLSTTIKVDPISKQLKARSGSFDGKDNLFLLVGADETNENYERVISACELNPRTVVLLVAQDQSAPGGFRVKRWWGNDENPLIKQLRQENVALTEENRSRISPVDGASIRSVDWNALDVREVLRVKLLKGLEEPAFQAAAALRAGMNVIFVGPPGTGKTSLARALFDAIGVRSVLYCATEHWTTFETIGGYFPEGEESATRLTFKPGAITSAIQNQQCLIIDEINRADIDKAFGELFTLFGSDDSAFVRLPYEIEKRPVVIAKAGVKIDEDEHYLIQVPSGWRIIASMNDADRASLKRFSLAFARRFAMVPVPVPGEDVYAEILSSAYKANHLPRLEQVGQAATGQKLLEIVARTFASADGLASINLQFGPGFALSILSQAVEELLINPSRAVHLAFLSALTLYVSPQLQGAARKHSEMVEAIKRLLPEASDVDVANFDSNLVAWTGGMIGR